MIRFLFDGEQSWPLPNSGSLASGGCLQAQMCVIASQSPRASADCQCTYSSDIARELTPTLQNVTSATHRAASSLFRLRRLPRKTALRCVAPCAPIGLSMLEPSLLASIYRHRYPSLRFCCCIVLCFRLLPSAECIIGRPRGRPSVSMWMIKICIPDLGTIACPEWIYWCP